MVFVVKVHGTVLLKCYFGVFEDEGNRDIAWVYFWMYSANVRYFLGGFSEYLVLEGVDF